MLAVLYFLFLFRFPSPEKMYILFFKTIAKKVLMAVPVPSISCCVS
jgi:hypothetical protein